MRDIRPPTDLRQSKARIAADECVHDSRRTRLLSTRVVWPEAPDFSIGWTGVGLRGNRVGWLTTTPRWRDQTPPEDAVAVAPHVVSERAERFGDIFIDDTLHPVGERVVRIQVDAGPEADREVAVHRRVDEADDVRVLYPRIEKLGTQVACNRTLREVGLDGFQRTRGQGHLHRPIIAPQGARQHYWVTSASGIPPNRFDGATSLSAAESRSMVWHQPGKPHG